MDTLVYVIDRKGVGPLLSYTTEKYEKLKNSLTKSGYREATLAEIKNFKNVKEVDAEGTGDGDGTGDQNEDDQSTTSNKTKKKKPKENIEFDLPMEESSNDEQPESNQ